MASKASLSLRSIWKNKDFTVKDTWENNTEREWKNLKARFLSKCCGDSLLS
ncbi:hypothetical protein RDI58_029038 [Solanum bulbocastanum]|uniref:Uncharacterized protein n=1 Tax=Solanum bulbocastanum TaxID=147425 RepID=A0AAN8XZ86_SOLBU